MWERTLFLLAVFTQVLGLDERTEIFDVTTVFEAGNTYGVGRIHTRTNALGLPLYGETDSIVPHETSQSLNTTCDSFKNISSWKMEGCSLKYDYQNVVGEQYYHYNNVLKFKLNNHFIISSGNTYFIFTSEKHIFSGFFHVACFYKYNYHYQNQDYSNLKFGKHCKQAYSYYNYDFTFVQKDGSNIYLNCEYSTDLGSVNTTNLSFYFDEYVQINTSTSSWGGATSKLSKIQDWRNDINVKYYHVDGNSAFSLHELVPVYSCESTKSEIISPESYLSSTQLCLVVVFNSPVDGPEPVLDVLAEDSKKNRLLLQKIDNTTIGWNVVHLNLKIPESLSGTVNIIIKKTPYRKISISRISSCNPDGEEIRLLRAPSHLHKSTQKFSSYLITTTAYVIEPVDKETSSNTTSCLNGGVPTAAGCACPPGFFHSACQLGCGRNRFGQDCGGLCSLWKSECEGLVLCTNPTGCHCAPGYEGDHCKTKCSDGWYGNDCSQRCGHCSSSCDIYTGECEACEPGYLPPLCKFESVYYPSKPQLTSPEYGLIKVSFNPSTYTGTSGTPELYQIQYKEKDEDQQGWRTYVNKNIEKHSNGSVKDMIVSENIEGLKDGVAYQVRVLFLDENFYKYDGDLVLPAEIITNYCEIPEVVDYKVEVESYTDSLIFSWSYDNTSQHWCPVENYEVMWKDSWQWFKNQTYNNFINLTDLLPGAKISFKVCANTSTGFSPYSKVLSASTITQGLSGVRNLKVDFVQSTSARVSWDPPTGNQDKQLQYCISYKCVDQPACSPGCQNVSEGQLTTEDTHVILKPLVPFTRYKVAVTPHNGPASSIYVGTSKDAPKEVPRPSNNSPLRTNTSLTVFWNQPEVCSGFLLGYNYQLVKEKESLKVLNSGFTKDTSVTFHNLTASTLYTVRVFVVNIAGWDHKAYLAINVSTSATVPEAVRNLTIYKRAKGMLGLRWAPPRAVYGQLKSFTVQYTLGQDETSHTIEPTPCVVWPELFCHTIEGLRSNRRYNITVSARNMEVPEDGEMASVTGVTKENPPTAPQNLKFINSTSTSIVLQWSYPELANGIIRSFLISVEETENYDQDNCCQIYPLVETFVKEEAKTYETEVSGLHPASTYFVSVSAKTVGMGPSQSLVAYTRPPHLPLHSLPRVEMFSLNELPWLPQQTLPDVNNSEIYTSLIKAHLLLAVVSESDPVEVAPESGITDHQLNSLLETNIEKPFYFIAEYNQDDVVTVTSSLESTESVWGHPPASSLPLQKYQLIAVQVSEYSGVFNVDLRFTQPFTLA